MNVSSTSAVDALSTSLINSTDSFFNSNSSSFLLLDDDFGGIGGGGEHDENSSTSPQVMVLCWLFVILFWMSTQSRIPDSRFRNALIERRERERRRKDPNRRKQIIEKSLITKKVIDCDENKTLTLGDVDGSVTEDSIASSTTFSMNSMEDGTSACVICLDAFRKGDIVTWSKQMGCRHVFHEDCLQEWLSIPSHDDCPSCRFPIIHDDGNDAENRDDAAENEDENKSIEGLEEAPSSSLAFVIIDGLVSPLRKARDSFLIGTSIDMNREEGDSDDGDEPVTLRRVFSLGRATPRRGQQQPSALQVAFRRVSSGLYTGLSMNDDMMNEDEEEQLNGNVYTNQLQTPPRLRRTLSEGPPPRFRRPASLLSDVGINSNNNNNCNNLSTHLFDEELGGVDLVEQSHPGFFRRTFRRVSSGIYAQLSPTVEGDDDDDDHGCDEHNNNNNNVNKDTGGLLRNAPDEPGRPFFRRNHSSVTDFFSDEEDDIEEIGNRDDDDDDDDYNEENTSLPTRQSDLI